MAWRDSRRQRGRLLLFISSIILGIAALVAIQSFGENLENDVNAEAKSLLGADLLVESQRPFSDSLSTVLERLGGEQSQMTSFASMVYFPKTENFRLVQVRAFEPGYPFYGSIVTAPFAAQQSFFDGQRALVEKALMLQFGAEAGDSIQLGNLFFEIEGQINAAPGRADLAASFAPVVFFPMRHLEATGLIQKGSRIEYRWYFKFDDNKNVEKLAKSLEPVFEAASVRYETVESRKERMNEAFDDLTSFLNLVGFLALLLGCIGVASAVHVYVRSKLSTVAILRCLGASGRDAFLIYLFQILIMGLIGAAIGVLIGSAVQLFLPQVLGDFLPLQNVSTDVSLQAALTGLVTGIMIALLFALLPLLQIRKTSPLKTLRASYEPENTSRDPWTWVIVGAIILFVAVFSAYQIGFSWQALLFTLAVVVSFLLLAGIARLLIWAVRRFFPTGFSYLFRQGLANLYRPNNQTLILITTIGLATAMIAHLFIIRGLLLKQVSFTAEGERPNLVLFDIQTSQKAGIQQLFKEKDIPLMAQIPIVNMRLHAIDGVTKSEFLKDTTSKVNDWVYNREYRVTYRDSLQNSDELLEGAWYGKWQGGDETIYISLADRIAEEMKATVGTRVSFNVQGTIVDTEVGSIRKLNPERMEPLFLVVFPSGVLEQAPQFHAFIGRAENEEVSGTFQKVLVKEFPNVSSLDISQVLESLDDLLAKVSFVVRFMAGFSMLTGVLVLLASLVLSKFQRIKESVLLRTIGASRRQILTINVLEYFILGALAVLAGVGISLIGAWIMATFVFEIPFTPEWGGLALLTMGIVLFIMLMGLLNSRSVVNRPPLEVLRAEVG